MLRFCWFFLPANSMILRKMEKLWQSPRKSIVTLHYCSFRTRTIVTTLLTLSIQSSESIRNAGPESYRGAFDLKLVEALENHLNRSNAEPLSYSTFKQTGINLNLRFKRYFFARIDEFLAENMNLSPKHDIADLVTRTGYKTGFHVEHILSYNSENPSLFHNDDELFEQERNRLGGILLLKGKDNISSGNESYQEKLRTYANTLHWNETLREDSYKSKLDMSSFQRKFNLDLGPLNRYGPEELETRHRLLFEMTKIIWA